jgi:hypothetical protein
MQYGDAFTLRVAGQRMTFLFAPAALQRYFTAPDDELTFAPAVQQVQGEGGWDDRRAGACRLLCAVARVAAAGRRLKL